MSRIFTASFGVIPVRFVLSGADLFVSKKDLYAAIMECFTPEIRRLGEKFLDGGLALLGDGEDSDGAILGDSEIGPALHFHAAGNLLSSLSDLTDVDSEALRESSKRVAKLTEWYGEAALNADIFFGRTPYDMLASVKSRLDRLNPPLPVVVSWGDGMYTAECDDLHLVTEAKTFEELTERVWELVPDMIECNELELDPGNVRLRFEVSQEAASGRRAM